MRGSDRSSIAVGAVGTTLAIFAVLALVFAAAAIWAERSYAAYPYRAGEESIRWLMPSMFRSEERPSVLIVGPSAVGEAILYEVVSDALSKRVLTLPVSNGTLNDVLLSLEYLERVHGSDVLPEYVVLGMTMRVLGNFPRAFGAHAERDAFSPLTGMIDKYSPEFRVSQGEFGSELTEKSAGEKVLSRARWATKQQPRHRTASLAVVEFIVDANPLKIGYQRLLPQFDDLRTPFSKEDLATTVSFVRDVGVSKALAAWLPGYRSAYHHMFMAPQSIEQIESATEGWRVVYDWDPMAEQGLVRHQLGRLREWLRRHSIGLTVVYLPEHGASRKRYDMGKYRSYRRLIEEELRDVPSLDLWQELANDQFYDMIHVTYGGARTVTEALLGTLPEAVSRSR